MTSGVRFPAILVVLVAVLSACGVTTRVRRGHQVTTQRVDGSAAAAVQRASREIPCGYDRMIIEMLGSGGFRIEGCGVVMTYTCVRDVCAPDARAAQVDTTQRIARPTSTWTTAQVEQLRRSIHGMIVDCLPEGTQSIRLQLVISSQGQVRRVGSSVPDTQVAACVDGVLSRGRMGGTVERGRTVGMDIRRGEVFPQALAAAPDPARAPGEPASIPPTVDTAARAAIDARAASILACVEADALSMQVSWSASGQLDALLRGERQGTPEESCVRAIVQRLTIAAPGAAGTIVHAVQR